MICAVCGHGTSLDWVGLFDFCPNCKTSPFPEAIEEEAPFAPGRRAILSSTRNRALNDLRDASLWDKDAPLLDRISWQLGYLESDFGREALNDGLYTPEEIEHAMRVLLRAVPVFA